jgi:hypothetical protein
VQLRTLFDLWDKAGDGHVNFVELVQGLGKMRRRIKHKQVGGGHMVGRRDQGQLLGLLFQAGNE